MEGENVSSRHEKKDPRRARSDYSPKHERTRMHESELNARPSHKNGETPRKRREPADESARNAKHGESDAERHSHRRSKRQSPDPRRRSRSPLHRRSSPRRHKSRSRSRSPMAHKRGDPRANAERNRQICYEFSRGTCAKGSSCKFLHEESEGRRNVPERQDTRGKNRKVDESHDRQTQEQTQGAMPTNGIAQQSDWPSVPALNHLSQPFGGNTSYADVNGSQVWMPAPVQVLPEQNSLYQLPQPPPPPPTFIPFSNFPAVVSQIQQMPQQQQQDHTVAPVMNLREPVMETFSPDMPGGKQNDYKHEEPGSGKSPDDVETETEKKSPDIAESGEEPEHEHDADGGEGEKERKSKKKKTKDSKSSMLVRIAVTEYVKEVLQPTWKEGKMSKDLYKTIAKKAVDKVVGTLQGNHIPKTQEKVDHFLDFSRQKISKLVQGYVDKYTKSA